MSSKHWEPPKRENKDKDLSVRDVAWILGVTEEFVRDEAQRGRLKSHRRIGRGLRAEWRFTWEAVDAYGKVAQPV